MEKRITKKLLAILMIITILVTDFYVLGSGLISYATDYKPIVISAYFKDGDGNKFETVSKSIKDENVKLYVDITVNSGYFTGTGVTVQNGNFNIKSSNEIKFKQINAGETQTLELDIEPITSNEITVDMLSQASTVVVTGDYTYSNSDSELETTSISLTDTATVKYQPDETASAELETEIITNKVLSVNGADKRVVQLLVKSRLSDNQYPVEYTELTISIPQLGTITENDISVLALGKLATNGATEVSSTEIDGTDLVVTLKNENTNNKINWVKDAYDELVVTFMYAADVAASAVEITTNSELKLYNVSDTYAAPESLASTNKDLSEVIVGKTEITTDEMYKGQLYVNATSSVKEEIEYETKTTIAVTNQNVVDQITVNEGPDQLVIDENNKLDAKAKYKTTEINLDNMLAILGQNGFVTIKNGSVTKTINQSTVTDAEANITVDSNRNVVITHGENSTTELEITTSEPTSTGILELKHLKVITDTYDRNQLENVKTLKTNNTTSATLGETKIEENSTETSKSSLELMETISKAELTVVGDEKKLATGQENDLQLQVEFVTDGVQYDLFNAPTIIIQLPEAVESAKVESVNILGDDVSKTELGTPSVETKNNGRLLKITLSGEQKTKPETQVYLNINFTNITLADLTTIHVDKISMTYTNANASQYYGGTTDSGTVEQLIGISGPGDLVTEINFAEKANASKLQVGNGDTVEFTATVLNDTESSLTNVKILGKLPTTGNTITGEETNTLATTVQSITASGATVYYTENADATTDINDTTNGWTESATADTKLYLIQLDTLSIGAYTATIKVKVSDTIEEGKASYTNYVVTADEITGSKASEAIALVTDEVTDIEFDIAATVSGDTLNAGDTVKEGEVITYTVTVTNNGENTLENVEVSAAVPEGTVLVEPRADGAIITKEYYTEKEDTEKVATYTLNAGQSETMQYEVRVKSHATASLTEISNKVVATYNNTKTESKEFKNLLEEANVRVTIQSFDKYLNMLGEGAPVQYGVYIENLSDTPIQGLKLKILADELIVYSIDYNHKNLSGDMITDEIEIDEIPGNSATQVKISGTMKENVFKMNIKAIVTDANEKIYKSNQLTQTFQNMEAEITLSSNKEDYSYVKTGDKVIYNITIKNVGADINGNIDLTNTISRYLEIQSIAINGNVTMQTTDSTKSTYIESFANDDNEVLYYLSKDFDNNETMTITIKAIVKEITEEDDGTVIIGKTQVKFLGADAGTSNEIHHILSVTTPEDLKNIISGSVLLDSTGKGLQGITVKLYDTINNCYLSDEDGEVITKTTDSNGSYTFTKVPSGSYKVVVEYDNEKYDIGTGLTLQTITVNGETSTVVGTEAMTIKDNVYDVNVELKNKTTETNPDDPETPTNPEDPKNPENPKNPDQPGSTENQKTISGFAWLDTDRDGQKDSEEITLSGIKVRVYDVSTKNYLTDSNGNIVETTTNSNGKYTLNIAEGKYILIFEYDTEEYEPTTYLAEGVDTTQNSKVVLKNISINGKETTTAVTDTINLQDNIYNINIGLKEKLIFDLELDKYISRIVVQTSKETKAYDYENSTFEKVEIHRKQIQGSLVVLEYTIKVKNAGEIAGYVKNIVDYLPSGLTFSSELNSDWYLSGSYLYTKGLENVELQPGEEKEIKLILTKTMTSENVGLINNRAEIYKDYNKYGNVDIDSTPNNQVQDEDDFGSVNVIIQVATGGSITAYIILLMINIILIGIAIRIMIKNNIIKISTKKERR